LCINTNYTDSSQLGELSKWIKAEVAEKGEGKFIIAAMHRAPYGGLHATNSVVTALRERIAPVLVDAGVSLVLCGHDHNYIRSFPVKDGRLNKEEIDGPISTSRDGAVFLTVSNSGQKTYDPIGQSSWAAFSWGVYPSRMAPGYCMFVKIEVSESQVAVTAYTVSGETVDSFAIIQ